MPHVPQELSRRTLGQGRFVALEEICYRGSDGVERRWESAERLGGRQAVLVIAELHPSRRLVLIRQFRPPAQAFVWEFPAGIIDAGENPAQAAARELLEETGYRGTIDQILPAAFSTPGLSSESVHTVRMTIDETLPENQRPVAAPDEGESIEVRLVARTALAAFIAAETAAAQTRFDSKLLAYLCGQ
jgi:ADP-ribose pyrophosphatase